MDSPYEIVFFFAFGAVIAYALCAKLIWEALDKPRHVLVVRATGAGLLAAISTVGLGWVVGWLRAF